MYKVGASTAVDCQLIRLKKIGNGVASSSVAHLTKWRCIYLGLAPLLPTTFWCHHCSNPIRDFLAEERISKRVMRKRLIIDSETEVMMVKQKYVYIALTPPPPPLKRDLMGRSPL